MTYLQLRRTVLLVAALVFQVGVVSMSGISAAHAQESARPDVARPLKAASDLMRSGRYKEALAEIAKADAVGNKTASESLLIERSRGSAALGAGDTATASRAFEAVLASGKLSAAEEAKISEALASTAYRASQWDKAIHWAHKAGTPAMRALAVNAAFQKGDYASAAKELSAQIAAEEKAGRKPTAENLQLLASSYQRMNNAAGYMGTLEKLLMHYPSKEYWADILARLPRKPGFSGKLAIDVYRLQMASGNLTKAADVMEAAQLALQAGLPAEGRKIIESGFASGALGTGAEAERHKRLRDLAIKQETEQKSGLAQAETDANGAKDGNALVQVGYQYVTYGQADKGVQLIEQGIAKGGLKRPDDATLRLALAQLQSGKGKTKAIQTLRTVQGTDGTGDIAKLWAILSSQSSTS
jgi:hypothetical protein